MTKKTVAPVLLLRGDDSVRVGEISKRRKFQTNKKLALHNPGENLIILVFFKFNLNRNSVRWLLSQRFVSATFHFRFYVVSFSVSSTHEDGLCRRVL